MPTDEHAVTLDSHLDAPSIGAPGYGPADTTDPDEIASSAEPNFAAATAAGHGTVNAVVKVGQRDKPRTKWLKTDRTEREQVTRPDGKTVTVERNLELGVSRIVD